MPVILKEWPHLIRIFVDFLSPQEASDVNAVSGSHVVTSVAAL